MVNNNTILNPDTPLAFLPPPLANRFQNARYPVISSLTIYVWDWLHSIPEEYRIFHSGIFNGPHVSYLLSRTGTLGFCVCAMVYQAAAVSHCQTLLYITGSFYTLGLSATSLLFFFRVRAVYGNSKIITGIFGLLWLTTSGLSTLAPFSIIGDHIGPTSLCMVTATRRFASVPLVFSAINDTLIFLAISFRVMSYSLIGNSWRARARSFFFADGLPRLSKALLQSGQLYYFTTVGFSIIFAAMILAPGIPAGYHNLFSAPNIVLASVMACRVYRAVKLGLLWNPQRSYTTGFDISVSARAQSGHELVFRQPPLGESRNTQVNLPTTATTDVKIQEGHIRGESISSAEEGSGSGAHDIV